MIVNLIDDTPVAGLAEIKWWIGLGKSSFGVDNILHVTSLLFQIHLIVMFLDWKHSIVNLEVNTDVARWRGQ